MAYTFRIGGVALPVTPGKLTVKINNANKSCALMNEGEINILKTPGLTEIKFDALLPNLKYSFAVYENGFQNAKAYLERLDQMKKNKETFQFVVSRKLPNGKELFETNMTCSLEDYSIIEEAEETGLDVLVSISLKQYREYGAKKCKVKKERKLKFKKLRKKKGIHIPKIKDNVAVLANHCYTVKLEKDMTVYNLAKKVYGDGELYPTIAEANCKYKDSRSDGLDAADKDSMWKKSKKLKKGRKGQIPEFDYK